MRKEKPYKATSLLGAQREVRMQRRVRKQLEALLEQAGRNADLLLAISRGVVRFEPGSPVWGEVCVDGIRISINRGTQDRWWHINENTHRRIQAALQKVGK